MFFCKTLLPYNMGASLDLFYVQILWRVSLAGVRSTLGRIEDTPLGANEAPSSDKVSIGFEEDAMPPQTLSGSLAHLNQGV